MIVIKQGREPAVEAKPSRVESVRGPDGINRPAHRDAVAAKPEGPPRVMLVIAGSPATIEYMSPEDARAIAGRMLEAADAVEFAEAAEQANADAESEG